MSQETRRQLAGDLRNALRALPASVRPKFSEIGAIAELLSEHPALARWGIVRPELNFGDMQN